MDKARWKQIIHEARVDDDLCNVLASFLEAQRVDLVTRMLEDDGRRLYEIRIDRPRVEEVERMGNTHWVVKA